MFIYQEQIKKFVEERNWGRFHNPKDLLLGLVEEVGEFRNIIKWVNDPETLKKLISKNKEEVKDTIGDMFWILSALANVCDVDIEEAIKMVIEDNKKRYPVEKSKTDHANTLLGGYDGKYKKE